MATATRPVTVVVDSTSDIPPDLAEEVGVRVVPLLVRFDEQTYRDGVDLDGRVPTSVDLIASIAPDISATIHGV